MTTYIPALSQVLEKTIESFHISKNGEWMLFVTTEGEEIRFCTTALVTVPTAEYWEKFAGEQEFVDYIVL